MRFFFQSIFVFVLSNVWAQNYNLQLRDNYSFNEELSDVWGYVDEFGNEYALVGRQFGFGVFDVSDPDSIALKYLAPGTSCTWRDIKTWGDFAYITTECGPGLLIVDMTPLPDTAGMSFQYWIDDSLIFYRAHNLFIDENGFAYLFGADYGNGGAVILDLTNDPWNPDIVGVYNDNYLHDGVVRGDTLWGSAVNDGVLQVIDVSDKSQPSLMSAWTTPGVFTHNAWISDNGKLIFTTDEVFNGRIAAYEVSNIYNPQHLDEWFPADTGIIPHNTHFINGFLVNSHYAIGVNIIDATRPNNMVQTGIYDTSPDYTYEGFHGCWGAYPWLPSGNVLATDIEKGLFVFTPTYQHACWLEGKVTDLHTGLPIYFPNVSILELGLSEKPNLLGDYATGTAFAGNYTVVVSAEGYYSDTATVVLQNGVLTIHDVQLNNWPTGLAARENSQIRLFPNPAVDLVHIRGLSQGMELRIFNVLGQEVMHNRVGNNQYLLEIVDFPAGMYIIELYAAERKVFSEKCMVRDL